MRSIRLLALSIDHFYWRRQQVLGQVREVAQGVASDELARGNQPHRVSLGLWCAGAAACTVQFRSIGRRRYPRVGEVRFGGARWCCYWCMRVVGWPKVGRARCVFRRNDFLTVGSSPRKRCQYLHVGLLRRSSMHADSPQTRRGTARAVLISLVRTCGVESRMH